MRYSYEYKMKCIEMYREGRWPETPAGIKEARYFHNMILRWFHVVEANGPGILKHREANKEWTPEEKYELVAKVLGGSSIQSVANEAGINSGLLTCWVRKYKNEGYNGLINKRKGRPPKEPHMKKINYNNPRKLNESEYEELVRLRAENEYIKAEIEVCASQGEKAAIIKELREEGYQLKYLLKAMCLSRSTYYYEVSKEDVVAKRSEAVASVIREIFEHNKGRYGVRRVHHELINRGYKVNHKKVQRLMHCMDLKGKRPKEKYHSYQGEVGKVADNLINRDFSTTKPLQKWTTDVSQFNLSWGKCYLSPILDMHTNEVISYDLSLSPNMEQIRRMLDKGLSRFSSLNGLIFHSDQGWQYQHAYFRNTIEKRGIIQSMSRKGNCYDNSIMETFFGRLKNEMFYGYEKDYKSYEEFSKAMAKYIDYYNNERIQAKTKWMPPVKYRLASMG